jgi:archaemetzincin
MSRYITIISLIVLLTGCTTNSNNKKKITAANKKPAPATVIKIVPLGKTTQPFITAVYNDLKKLLDSVVLLEKEEMPASAYYAPRKRYRADTLIHWMSSRAKENEVYAGITMQDISTTKGDNPDYGVMGLGFKPGKACVASSFRLRDKKNFFKVLIHELGHTAGLPHCPEKTCFMRDAEGGDPTGEEKEFCMRCKSYLKEKGWKL